MPAPAELQRKTAASAVAVPSIGIAFDTTPTIGNLIVAFVCADVTMDTPGGFTLAVSNVAFVGLYCFRRVFQSGDSSSVNVFSSGVDASMEICAVELETATVDRTANAATGTVNGSTIPSGTTAATTEADEQAYAAFGWNDNQGVVSASSYSNSFTEVTELKGIDAADTNLALATKTLSAIATQTSTATLSAAINSNKSGIIVTFTGEEVAPPWTPNPRPAPAGMFDPELDSRAWY